MVGAGLTASMGDEASEADLLEAARAGDAAAYGRLVRLHQRRILACAMKMMGDEPAAEDALQETFLRAWRALSRFDGRSELSTWLYRICVNVCLNHLRKRTRRVTADLEDPRVPDAVADPTQGATDPERSTEAAQLERALARALGELSPSLRTTVVLVLIEGVSHREAADILGCPVGTVAWRVHEARRRLRVALSDVLGEGEGELPAILAASGGTS